MRPTCCTPQTTMANKNYVVYPAVFDNEDNEGYYTVTFPDIPDTVTDGKTLEEAFLNAPEAIGVALPDYKVYPTPTPLERVQKNNPNKIVNLIGVNMKEVLAKIKDPTVRKNVTIPQSIAEQAVARKLNFSAVLTEALRDKLGV